MSEKKSTARKIFILLLVLVIPSVVYIGLSTQWKKGVKLPTFGPRTAIESGDTTYHSIPEFSFTNQHDEQVTSETFQDAIYVADFFFTTCKSICPAMNHNMEKIQSLFQDDEEVMLLSHTVDPGNDSVEVLKAYADNFGAQKEKWHLVTGEKPALYEMARKGYFITAMDGDGGEEDFIHSELLVLVDPNKHIRGYYDGTDTTAVTQLIDDIKLLQLEWLHKEKKAKNDAKTERL